MKMMEELNSFIQKELSIRELEERLEMTYSGSIETTKDDHCDPIPRCGNPY